MVEPPADNRQNSDNRIPSNELGDCRVWRLPAFGRQGNIIPSAEREDRERSAKGGPTEFIEDVSGEQEIPPMTADMLKKITEEAEKEGLQRGYDEGLAKGLEQGREQGLDETRRDIQEQQQRLASIADALIKPMSDQDSALEDTIMDMVRQLTESVIKRELTVDSSNILSIVQQAITALPIGSKHLKVYLNPDDLALVEAFAEEQQKDWQFIGESSLLPGGCRIETNESLVNHTTERRVELLFQQLLLKKLTCEQENPVDPIAASGSSQ